VPGRPRNSSSTVADEVARRVGDGGQIAVGLVAQRLAVFAGEQPFVIEGADLAVEGAGAPVLVGLPHSCTRCGRGIVHPQKVAVMGPAQSWTQCV